MSTDQQAARYELSDDGRRLPTGGPLNDEYYGPFWAIRRQGASLDLDPAVLIPDPGDGSAEPLARKIVGLLNSDTGPE